MKTKLIFLKRVKREYNFYNILNYLITTSQEEDIVYLRIPYPSIQLTQILKKARLCKICIEYQTIEPLEYKLIKKYWYLILDFFFGNAIRTYTDAIVGVTDEITSYQLSRAGNQNKPHITIGNGFDVASATVRHPPKYDGKDLHLLCVAHIRRWNGLDRLLNGIANHHNSPKIILHIAGDGEELSHLQELAVHLGITDRVVYHGFTTGRSLDTLFNTCHIGVGSLGIHRIGLKEASILKAREYCARGLPFMYGIKDPDFPLDFPFILQIPPDESPVDMKKVISFAETVCTDHDTPRKMHRYAEEHLDWSVKMKTLKGFLETMSESRKGRPEKNSPDL